MAIIDLRSDTVTLPTPEMRKATYEAELGDDQHGEDPTAQRLEAMAAERLGKEAALLVASGRMGNLVCILSHCQRGDEIITGSMSHIFLNEGGSASALGSVHVRTVPDRDGIPDPGDVEEAIRATTSINLPRSSLLCLENTHNAASGAVSTPEQIATLARIAHDRGLAVHLDGARLFNAAVALDIPVAKLARDVDSVTFCLSKGLCCPAGSLVCGSHEFIQRARKNRGMVGGAMRQVGVIAAPGIVALESMVDRLAEDHDNARRLAQGLAQIPGFILDPERIQSDIVIFEIEGQLAQEVVEALKARGVLCMKNLGNRIRMVTHYGITTQDIDAALEVVDAVMRAHSAVA